MKKININELIWFIILILFSLYIYTLFDTERINLYMHPKMFNYIYLSLFVFILLSIFQIKKIFHHSGTKRIKLGYIIFLLPLLLAFIINPKELRGKAVYNKGINMGGSQTSIIDEYEYSNDEYNEEEYGKEEYIEIESLEEDKSNLDILGYGNTLEGQKFLDIINQSYMNLDEMIGKEIEIEGFVYREESFAKNEFLISRLLISCCAADAQVGGLLCQYGGKSHLENDEWIRITGTIDSTNYKDQYSDEEQIIPVVKITDWEKIEPPESPYIY